LSKDSLERPRFVAKHEDITLKDNRNRMPGSDGIITPDKIL
jgi:hypothetical protein